MDTINFKIETDLNYLASCSHSPLHSGISNSLRQYASDLAEYGNPWDLWMEKIAEAKALFAKLINASEDEIAPHFSVSSALGSLLSAFDYTERNKLITSDMEYPTTNYVMLGQEKYGAKLVTIKNRGYRLTPDDYVSSADSSSRLVSAVHVSSLNGFKQDIGAIAEMVHHAGSEVYVDAYQSLGNTFIDVKNTDVDYLAGGTLKYLLGLPGLAFLYVRRDHIEGLMPSYVGWFSQKNPFLFGAEKMDYSGNADRFQSGTLAIPSVYASIEGMKVILNKGVQSIEGKISMLTARALDIGSELGMKTITPEESRDRGAIVSFIVRKPHDLEMRLRKEGIITSSRDNGLRIAPHFFNTESQVEEAVTRIHTLAGE